MDELKQKEAAAAGSIRTLDEALATMGVATWRACPESGALRHLSPAVETLTGYPLARFEHIGDLLEGLALPTDRDGLADIPQRLSAHGRVDVRYRVGHADGSTRWLQCRAIVRSPLQPEEREIIGTLAGVT